MKTQQRLSGPVLAFGIVAIIFCSLVGWFGIRRQLEKPTADAAAPAEVIAATPTANTSAEPAVVEAVVPYDLSQGIPPVIPVSLAALLVKTENDVWTTQPWVNYPRGLQKFCSVDFNIEGVLQIESPGSIGSSRSFRKSIIIPLTITNATESEVTVTEIGTNVGCIHILGATRYSGYSTQGEKVAEVVWHYANGQQRRSPIEYAVHTRDWRRMRYEDPERVSHPGAKVVWRSDQRLESDRNMRLYRYALANPDPGRQVKSVEFVTAGANPSLFLTALSLDPLPLGVRPDDSPDLEEVDPPPARSLQIFVQDSEGTLIQGARIRAHYQQVLDGKSSFINKSLGTDANGSCMFRFPMLELDKLDLYVWHEGSDHAGRKMTWETTAGDIIPPSYTFTLSNGIAIGGTVVDESDVPVADAKLSFYHYSRNGDDDKRGDKPDMSWRSAITDAQGTWQLRGVPPEFLDSIGFSLKHPDFTDASGQVGENPIEQAKFRDGTHKIVLKRGLIVRGRVIDGSDNPIKDAQVWAGKQYYFGTQDTKTDAKGEFSFRNLKEGEVQFSVLAKGQKPETKNITVKPGMTEIVFKLGKGSVIRGVVRDENGVAVPDVNFSLQSRSMDGSRSLQFAMKSDKDGRFEWDGAPDESQRFSIYKQGYETKDQTLNVAEENVVTLRKGREVRGWVVDAETEKPITKFRVGVGQQHDYGDSIQFYARPGMKDFSDPNGMFTLTVSDEQSNAIKGEADDYAAIVEKLPAAENGVVKVTLRLKPSPALRGTLVDSQGSPVAGGTVALTEGGQLGSSVMLRNGRLSAWGSDNKVVTTEASGNFKLQSPPESGGVVVGSGANGFGSASVAQVRSSGRLVLQGFGRIEGSLKVAGVPTAGELFSFNIANIGVSYQSDGFATSDADGKFKFEKLPAGEGSVIRLIKMTENSWRHSHNTSVSIEPGKTTKVSFGEDGAVIKGRFQLGFTPAEGEALTYDGGLSTKMPPMDFSGMTQEEAQAYVKSPEYKERMKQMKHYGVSFAADGSFSLDSIPPGEYTLSISANKAKKDDYSYVPPVATGNTTITVPEHASPYAPIGIPDVILMPMPEPKPKP